MPFRVPKRSSNSHVVPVRAITLMRTIFYVSRHYTNSIHTVLFVHVTRDGLLYSFPSQYVSNGIGHGRTVFVFCLVAHRDPRALNPPIKIVAVGDLACCTLGFNCAIVLFVFPLLTQGSNGQVDWFTLGNILTGELLGQVCS